MTEAARPADSQTLLAHGAFVRALARDLVRDDATADDVAQETMLAAMSRPPQDDRPLTPWFATVVRRVASKWRRGEARRGGRERLVGSARRTWSPASDETAARLDTCRVLVEEVRSLDEPFRSTVLLRYFDGLATAEIAARDGVPEATVRTRLKRGLDRLRERLDARHEGDREAWVAGLAVPIAVGAGRPGPSPTSAVSRNRWLAVGSAAALIVAAVLLWRTDRPASSDEPTTAKAAPERPRAPRGPAGGDSNDAPRVAERPRTTPRVRTKDPAPETPSTFVVRGRVLDADGAPAGGAMVRGEFVEKADAPPSSVSSSADDHGEFALAGVAAGDLAITVSHPRWVDVAAKVAVAAADVEGVVLTLGSPPRIVGNVSALDGANVAGAVVEVELAVPGQSKFKSLDGAQTMSKAEWKSIARVDVGADGAYEIHLPQPRGMCRVTATMTGRATLGPRTVTFAPPETTYRVDFAFARSGPLEVVVRSATTGATIAGAAVAVSTLDGAPLGWRERKGDPPRELTATTDAEGRARFDLLAEGAYDVRAQAPGRAARSVRGKAPGTVVVELTDADSGAIAGHVVFDDGAPAFPIRVWMRPEAEPTGPPPLEVRTDAQGAFRFADLPPGRYVLHTRTDTGAGASDALVADTGPIATGTLDVKIVVAHGLSLAGRVVDEDGKPMPRVYVNCMMDPVPAGASPSSVGAPADADGKFLVTGLRPGKYRIAIMPFPAEMAAGVMNFDESGFVAGDRDARVVMRHGLAISGVVVDGNGAPLAVGSVRAMPLDPGANPHPVNWRSGRVGRDGSFTIAGVPAGSYRLQLFGVRPDMAPGGGVQGPTRPPALVLAGGERVVAGASQVRLTAFEGLHVNGRVVGDGDKPLARIIVWVLADERDTIQVYTDDDGRFDVYGLDAAEPCTVRAFSAGYRPALLKDVRPGGPALAIAMDRGLTATGRVVDADGAPVANTRIDLTPVEGAGRMTTRGAETDADGRFVAGNLEDREYKALVKLLLPGSSKVRTLEAGRLKPGDRDLVLRISE